MLHCLPIILTHASGWSMITSDPHTACANASHTALSSSHVSVHVLSLIEADRSSTSQHGLWVGYTIVRLTETVVLLIVRMLLLVMLLLLVVETKGALVLVMLMSKDMLRHALMLEHCDRSKVVEDV